MLTGKNKKKRIEELSPELEKLRKERLDQIKTIDYGNK